MMEQVDQIIKIVKCDSKFEIIKFQLYIYRFCKSLNLSDAEVNAIAYVLDKGFHKRIFLEIVELGYFKNTQAARNAIIKATNLGILLDNKYNHIINSDTGISTSEKLFIQIKAHNLES